MNDHSHWFIYSARSCLILCWALISVHLPRFYYSLFYSYFHFPHPSLIRLIYTFKLSPIERENTGPELDRFFDVISKAHAVFFLFSLQSTSGSPQVGLLPQGVRLLRSPAVPQSSSDAFTFPQTPSPLEQNFMVEDVNTPKVGSPAAVPSGVR